jgi:hypothetical protein
MPKATDSCFKNPASTKITKIVNGGYIHLCKNPSGHWAPAGHVRHYKRVGSGKRRK